MVFAALIGLSLLAFYGLRQPSLEGNWEAHLKDQSAIVVAADSFKISNIHDWFYDHKGPVRQQVVTQKYRFDSVQDIWFFVEPFETNDAIAHTMLMFRFADGRLLGLTIEARKQVGETYSALGGMARKFELLYIWNKPSDMLSRRAAFLQHKIYAYPLDVPQAEQINLLKSLIVKTNGLVERPRFYNTLRHNCTNEFAQSAGLLWGPAHVLTGRAPKYLAGKGYIDAAAAGRKIDISEAVAAIPYDRFESDLSTYLDQLR